jgi:biopolymer transport protein ExbB
VIKLFIAQQITETAKSLLTHNWLIETLNKGGWYIMYPLLFFSLVSFGIIIERLYKYFSIPNDKKINSYLTEIQSLLDKSKSFESVVEWCSTNKTIFSFIFLKILKRFKFLTEEKRDVHDIRNELLQTGDDAAYDYLSAFLPVVDTIASVATLLGLLGTILGMIISFDEIAKGGKGDPAVVAGGISIALLTTAAGLIVAIPSVLGFSYLKRKVLKILDYVEPYTNHFVNTIINFSFETKNQSSEK